MGSLGHSGDATLRPATRLPLFNTTVQTSDVRSYHQATVQAIPVVHDRQVLLERFARFIVAVSDGKEVAFIADTGCQQLLVHVALTSQDTVELTKAPYNATTSDITDLDFGIYAPELVSADMNNDLTKLLQPLILSVLLSNEGRVADVTICLRGDHGPEAAAHHLLQLAIAYIGPKVKLDKIGISRLTTPSLPDPMPKNNLLHSILEESTHSYPHNIAIDEVGGHALSYTRRELTYSELNTKASMFADQIEIILQKLDWPAFQGEQRMVPIFLPNSIELNICMNGISKAGHCFCPLQMDAPEERLRDLLSDLHAPGILGLGSNPWAGCEFGDNIIWIDCLNPTACLVDRPGILDGPLLTRRTPCEDDLAYIMYTSGSTGKPKGVLMLHRNAVAYIRAFDAGPGGLPTGPRMRWMIMSSPTFDIVLMDNFMPLFKGGTVCVAERDLLLTNPEAVIVELRATATFTVTSLAMLLHPERIPTLTWLCVGGEMVSQRVVDNFAPRTGDEQPDRRFFVIYGPTETTVMVSVHVCDSASRPSVIGAPLPGAQFVVLDMDSPELRAVPLGVAGELAIGGPQLSPGYLNRPKETAHAFIQDAEFGHLYRTGDRVRVVWSEDGEPRIDFLGRTSFGQVKLNGRRVELPEIENVLSRADGAAQVAVLVFESKLLACVMPWERSWDAATVESQCRAEAERYLPAWMQPVQYLVMAQFPHGANGKVSRKALETIISQNETQMMGMGGARAVVANGTGTKEVKPSKALSNGTANITSSIEATMNGRSTGELDVGEAQTTFIDTASIVYESLDNALGKRIEGLERSTALTSIGLDSLRALVFLQKLRELGIKQLEIHEVLWAASIGELIETVEKQRTKESNTAPAVTAFKELDSTNDVPAKSTSITTTVTTINGHTDGIDVGEIAADDADIVYDLPLEAKVRHFDHHCRAPCLKALGLSNHQVEQVLPVTNVQARFVALAVDPTFFDRTRYTGRPHVTHFAYQVPDDMDPARLQRAVDVVLPRYDCFRTVFVPISHPLAPFAQCILSPSVGRIPKVEIVCDDADADGADSLWREIISGAQRSAEAAMSINRPGITVTYVWSQNRARCVFILSLFHGIYDGTQVTYLCNAIMDEYIHPGSKPAVDLLPIRTAVELNLSFDWVQTLIYWAGRFTGVPGGRLGSRRPMPIAELPGSYPGGEKTHMQILSVKASMTMRELNQAAANMSTTMLTVAEAAWASVMAQTFPDSARADAASGKKPLDIQFGTVMNGRRNQDALRCMAPMLAALPMRLLINGSQPSRTNRETCTLLASQRTEAQPYLQIPCPTLSHAQMGIKRIDTILLVQALQPEEQQISSSSSSKPLPGFNFEQNLLSAYKETDSGYPINMELWPGRQRWDEKMLFRCIYNVRRPGYEFLTRDWVLGVMSALDEAIRRITSDPDGLFYTG